MIVRCHAAADAQRDHAVDLSVRSIRRARCPDHRAGGAKRMAERDRAAIDVDLGIVDVEGLDVAQTTEANASFNSNRSISDSFMPERSNSFWSHRTGPVSIIAGRSVL